MMRDKIAESPGANQAPNDPSPQRMEVRHG